MTGLYDVLLRAYRVVGALLIISLILAILASITLRELFGVALVWANEVAITLFVWAVFVGAGIAFAENAHIRFTILVDRLPPRGQRVLALLVTYVGVVLLVGLWVTSLYLAYLNRDQRFTTIPVSAAWEWSSVPFGLTLAILGWIRYGKWTWRTAGSGEKATDAVIL